MSNWKKEFRKKWRRATGANNIVGDLIIMDFISEQIKEAEERGFQKGLNITGDKLKEVISTIKEKRNKIKNI